MDRTYRKRTRSNSGSPPPWRRENKSSRYDGNDDQSHSFSNRGRSRGRGGFQGHLQRKNQEQEERQMRHWMSQEDDFVLKQSKKKAQIRIKEGRAKPIDQLVLMLSIIDPDKDPLDDDLDTTELDIKEPVTLVQELSQTEMQDIEQEIEHYLVLEHNEINLNYWQALKTISQHRQQEFSSRNSARGISTVSADVDRLLSPKSLEQLQVLESQVHQKLRSDEAIDEEYWEQLLDSITLYKARAHLHKFYASVNQIRLKDFQRQQIMVARKVQASMVDRTDLNYNVEDVIKTVYTGNYEPNPLLRLGPDDRGIAILDENEFTDDIAQNRARVAQMGYVAASNQKLKSMPSKETGPAQELRPASDDHSSVTHTMYDREAAKGVEEDEEVFAGEEEVVVDQKPMWSSKFRPRKPKHFNRVQMGYEWNKYNQTHYDHDNPPPKVVQGYKFNIFYPDLIDQSKAPTYRIERENGRKKGQSFAPAGEEDTCLIRFISGPPYEDIAFRIVDREWDYSAKRERGFKSSFDKGILQLHFQFKKIHYRK